MFISLNFVKEVSSGALRFTFSAKAFEEIKQKTVSSILHLRPMAFSMLEEYW